MTQYRLKNSLKIKNMKKIILLALLVVGFTATSVAQKKASYEKRAEKSIAAVDAKMDLS